MIPSNGELTETQLDNVLGGAPKEVVSEFSKPGELSEEDLDSVFAGLADREVAVEENLKRPENYREEQVSREKAAMFAELEQAPTNDNANSQRR